MAKKRPFSLFPEKTPLIDAALALSRGNHIIGVSTAAEPTKVERIISQAQLYSPRPMQLNPEPPPTRAPSAERWCLLSLCRITFCQTQFENLKVPVDMLMTSPVLSVKCKDKTVKAFKIMATKRISAMSVVDESGEVQHNVSTSDIKSFFTPPFENPHSALQEPIEDFLIRLRARGAASKTRIPVSTCLKGEELSSVVAKLNRAKYHHAWVVGTDRKPVGVLSLTDVFSHIYGKSGKSKSRSGFCSVQ
jgi:predicted transcriptional regulator